MSAPSYFLAFYQGSGRPDDRLIRFATNSHFSHVELVHANEGQSSPPTLAEAISASGRDGGVRQKKINFENCGQE